MLRVGLAGAKAQVVRGMVPGEAHAAIARRARVDVDRISEIEKTTDHDVIAFVSQVAESVGPEGRFLHLGLTSSDVVDTGLVDGLGCISVGESRRQGAPARNLSRVGVRALTCANERTVATYPPDLRPGGYKSGYVFSRGFCRVRPGGRTVP